jgi:hypothetical protein
VALSIEQTGPASAILRDGPEVFCEIRDLGLCNARFRPGGRKLIGEEVPLPLYWMQYANHEDPERNAGSNGVLRILASGPDRLEIECGGTTGSGSVQSRYLLTVYSEGDPPRYVYDVTSDLAVAEGQTWSVTPNPGHGEIEFCNFWADGIFSPDPDRPLRYNGSFLLCGDHVRKIPHHHVESSDKHNIVLRQGDRMAWFLEDENPCVTVLSEPEVTAGICAYMWDAHFAYKVCQAGRTVALPGGTTYSAAFRISSIGREEARRLADPAEQVFSPEASAVPAVVDGLHTFAVMCSDSPDAWPWETALPEGDPSAVKFTLDRTTGYGDDRSLRIEASSPVLAQWMATTFGPAYRKAPFPDGARYRLEARVRTALTGGAANLAVRLHRQGEPGLFDPGSYEVHRSTGEVSGTTDWSRFVLMTPPVSPPPDRLHILLELRGSGTCWFDNVQLTVET